MGDCTSKINLLDIHEQLTLLVVPVWRSPAPDMRLETVHSYSLSPLSPGQMILNDLRNSFNVTPQLLAQGDRGDVTADAFRVVLQRVESEHPISYVLYVIII